MRSDDWMALVCQQQRVFQRTAKRYACLFDFDWNIFHVTPPFCPGIKDGT